MRAAVPVILLACASCAPLPEEPVMRGPADATSRTTSSAGPQSSRTRELVWMKGRKMIRITRTERMCREDESSGSGECVPLSSADKKELDRFFGAESFRERWAMYRPCPAAIDQDSSAIFAVTFADGKQIGKILDAPVGSPLARACDRTTRNTVAQIGDDLMDRYFR